MTFEEFKELANNYGDTLWDYMKVHHFTEVGCIYMGRQLDPAFAILIGAALTEATISFLNTDVEDEEELDKAFIASVQVFRTIVKPVIVSVDEATEQVLGKKFSDVLVLPKAEKIHFFLKVGRLMGMPEEFLMNQILQQMSADTDTKH